MLTGRIRQARTVTVDVQGESVEELQQALAAATPAGYELVSSSMRSRKGSFTLDSTGTFAERGEVREVEGANLDEIRSRVPEGWELLSVRSW